VRPFEAASIRAHKEPRRVIEIRLAGNRLNAVAEFARGLIMWAYQLRNFQAPKMMERR
jgi:hypothetical protein